MTGYIAPRPKPSLPRATLYAIIDGPNEEGLLPMLEQFSPPASCLYADPVQPELVALAPYLLQVTDEVKAWLDGRETPWGFYFTSYETMKLLRQHWRKYLQIQIPAHDKPVYFRFYDPRVLWTFLEAIELWQQHLFLKPVRTMITLYGTSRTWDLFELHECWPDNVKLHKKLFALTAEQYQRINSAEEDKYRLTLLTQAQQWLKAKEEEQLAQAQQQYDIPYHPDSIKGTWLEEHYIEEQQRTSLTLRELTDDLYDFCMENGIKDDRSVRSLLWLLMQKEIGFWKDIPEQWLEHLQLAEGPGYYRVEKLLIMEAVVLPQLNKESENE
ncbi:MAG: DUF4123 domain-containing protein [Enterobacteriaceae bacterium]